MKRSVKITSIILLVVASVTAWYFSYHAGLVTTYNDAMSHLDIARSVIDSKQPGIAQLGSVWLPLNHILFLTLIWNNWAWHSGFAGSFFSMLAYIFSAIGIYMIVIELTDNVWAGVLGALAFALNPNMLYLQTTPLTEPLYLVLFIASVLFLIKFFKTNDLRYILLAGIFGFLQVLARYDGWFVVFIEGLVVLYHQRFILKANFQETIAKFLLFAMPVIFAASLWLLWNKLIFGSFFYFILGPYSAHAQQVAIQNTGGLITKGNWSGSLRAYWYSVTDNIGIYLTILSFLGLILFLAKKTKIMKLGTKTMAVILLLSPIIFNVLALYLGFSILNVPQLHWNPSLTPSGQWFNVRYGILALPFIAVCIGLLVEQFNKKIWVALLLAVVVIQSFWIYRQGLITVTDGTIGTSAFVYSDIAQVLQQNVKPNENVLISLPSFNAVTFKSGLPLSSFIYEGISQEWTDALVEPQNYAQWIVAANGNASEAVYAALVLRDHNAFLKYYKTVYCDSSACVYELKTKDELFVYANGTNLLLGDNPYVAKGVNSYDLAYQSTSTIDATFKNLSSIGVNTVRFWMFGDGNSDGFQPAAGIMNETRFEEADYVIADAKNYNIRLIPVLVNNWTDYGGEQQYLTWVGQNPSDQDAFYTNPQAIALFENYINHVITRKNTITGVNYDNDPTIMAWEIVNEPRWSTNDTQGYINWFSTITNYIKQKDPNHLITVETDDASGDYCAILPVDICSEHLYLYNNVTPTYPNLTAAENNLRQYIAATEKDDKPFMLGEIGISKETYPFGENPLTVLKALLDTNTGSGSLIWNWSEKPDTSYGFSPLGTDGVYTLKQLSGVLEGPPPTKIYTSPYFADEGGYDVSTPGAQPESTISTAQTIPIATSTPEIVPPPATNPKPVPAPDINPTPAPTVTATTSPSQEISVPMPKSLPYSTTTFDTNDWASEWGTLSATSGGLMLGSNASGTSAETLLNGSSQWTDYTFTATIDWVKGQTFSLIARYNDGNNDVSCSFDNLGNISAYRLSEGQNVLIGDGSLPNFSPSANVQASIEVNKDHITCGLNGAVIGDQMYQGLPLELMTGGIGFNTWDPTAGNSSIVIKQVSVTPAP